jgi:hypothetical protein
MKKVILTLAAVAGIYCSSATAGLQIVNGLSLVNGLSPVNGLSLVNGLIAVNGTDNVNHTAEAQIQGLSLTGVILPE